MENTDKSIIKQNGEKLQTFLNQQESTRNLMRDLLQNKEVTQQDYNDFVSHQQEIFNLFIIDLKTEILEQKK